MKGYLYDKIRRMVRNDPALNDPLIRDMRRSRLMERVAASFRITKKEADYVLTKEIRAVKRTNRFKIHR
jgi:hypothetical protein